MKAASNLGILTGCLQVLHIHVFLISPLGTGRMTQPLEEADPAGFVLLIGCFLLMIKFKLF